MAAFDYLGNADAYGAAARAGTARGYRAAGYAAPRRAVDAAEDPEDYFSPLADDFGVGPRGGAGSVLRAAKPVDPLEEEYKRVSTSRKALMDQEVLYAHRLKDFDANEGAALKIDKKTGGAQGFGAETNRMLDDRAALGDNAGAAALAGRGPLAVPVSARERALRQNRQRLVDEHDRIQRARQDFDERSFRPVSDRRASAALNPAAATRGTVPDLLSPRTGNLDGMEFVEGFNQNAADRQALGLTQRAPGSVSDGNFTPAEDAESSSTPTPPQGSSNESQPDFWEQQPDVASFARDQRRTLTPDQEEEAVLGNFGIGPRPESRAAPGTAAAREAMMAVGNIAKGAMVSGMDVPNTDEFGREINPQMGEDYRRRKALPRAEQLKEIQDSAAYRDTTAFQDAAREVYGLTPEQEHNFFTKAGGMAGGFLPLMAATPAGAPLAITLQTIGDETERIYRDQIEKGTEPDAAAEFAINRANLSGGVQGLLFEALPKPLRGLTDRLIVDKLANRFLANRLAQVTEGATLGGGSTAASNLAADRPVGEGVAESALGMGLMQGVMPRGGSVARDKDPRATNDALAKTGDSSIDASNASNGISPVDGSSSGGGANTPPIGPGAVPPTPPTTPNSFYRRLDYSDVSGTPVEPNESARKYAEALAGRSIEDVNATANKLRSAFDTAAGAIGLEPGRNSKSESWAIWDIGKQLHLAENPSSSNEKYRLGDPLSDANVQTDIVDRMLGYELSQGVDKSGHKLPSWRLTEIGRKAREDAGFNLELEPSIPANQLGAPEPISNATEAPPVAEQPQAPTPDARPAEVAPRPPEGLASVAEAGDVANDPTGGAKPLPEDWRVTVQEPQGGAPGYVQIDRVGADGDSAGSVSPEALRAEGYDVPDYSTLRQGQYRAGELAQRATESPSETSTAVTGENQHGPNPIERLDEARVEPRSGLDSEPGQRPGASEPANVGPDEPSGGEQPRGGESPSELAGSGRSAAPDADLGQPRDASRPLTDEPPASPPAPLPEGQTVGIKNASVDALRQQLNLPPEPPREGLPSKQAHAEALARTAQDPEAQRRVVDDIDTTGRQADAVESIIISKELVDANRARQEAEGRLDAATEIGDPAAIAQAKTEVDATQARFNKVSDVAYATGTRWSDVGRMRQQLLNQDYSLAEQVRRQERTNGGPVTPEQMATIKRDVADLQAANTKLEQLNAAHQQRIAVMEAERATQAALQRTAKERRARANPPPEVRARGLERLSQMADEARERLSKRAGLLLSVVGDEGPARPGSRSLQADLHDISIIAADLLAKGVVATAELGERLVKEFGEKVRPHLPAIMDNIRKARESAETGRDIFAERTATIAAMQDRAFGGASMSDLSRYARKLQEQHVAEGITTREALVDAVHENLKEVFPDVTRREASDAMSGYGDYSELSKDPVAVTIRDINGQLQNLSKLEDMQAGQAPSRTGVERRTPSDEERRLIKQVNDAKKRGGFTVQDPERQLRTTQDAIKTRLRNEIADLDFQIATGEKTIRERTAPVYDAEALALRERRDALKKVYDEKFPDAELTDAERNQRAIDAADAQIAELERQVASGDVGTGLPGRRPAPSPELAVRQARLEALRAERDLLRSTDQFIAEQRSDALLTQEADSLRQQIAEKEARLAADDTDPQGRPVSRPADPRIEQLIQQRDAANRKIAEARRTSDSAVERIQGRELKRINDAIADRQAKLDAGDLGTDRATRVNRPLPPELEAAKQKLESINQQIAEARQAAKPRRTEAEIRQAALKSHLLRRLAQLMEREARQLAGDFTPPARREPVPLSEENLAARADAEQIKRRVDARQRAEDARNRTRARKVYDKTKEVLNTSRSLLSSWDLSAVLRQGGKISLANLPRAARAVGTMMKALGSERAAHITEQEIASRPNAPRYKSSKLYFAPLDEAKLTAKEEQIMSNLAEKIPVVGRGVRASNRAFVTFLNRLRADSFDAMVGGMEGEGATKLTKPELDAISNYINVATGRGNLGAMAGAAEPLATVFFSPRLVTSRFQLLAGQPLYGGTARTRRVIAAEYAKYLGAVAGVLGLGALAGADVELDPRSSDFGKLKIGNTRIDVLSGLAQTTTFITRMLTRQTKDSRGAVQDLAATEGKKTSPMQGTVPGELGRFARSKLAPVPGTALDLLAGKNVVGEPVTPRDAALNLIVPLTFRDATKIMEENGVAGGTGIEMLNVLGAGVNNYNSHPGSNPKANRVVIDRGLKYPTAGALTNPDPRRPYTQADTDAYHKAFEESLASLILQNEARLRIARPDAAKGQLSELAALARVRAKAQVGRGR